MPSSNSWGHTCKSHLISFTEVAEWTEMRVHIELLSSPARSIQDMVFAHRRLFQYSSLMSRNTVSTSNFWPPLRRELGMVDPACHPSFSGVCGCPQAWGCSMLGQPGFYIMFGISLMMPELRSAGSLRRVWTYLGQTQSSSVSGSTVQFI